MSQIIRAWIADHPNQTPKPIVEGIKIAHGLTVTSSLVNAIKYGQRKDQRSSVNPRKIGRTRATSAATNGESKSDDLPVTLEELIEAKAACARFKNLGRMVESAEALAQLIG